MFHWSTQDHPHSTSRTMIQARDEGAVQCAHETLRAVGPNLIRRTTPIIFTVNARDKLKRFLRRIARLSRKKLKYEDRFAVQEVDR